MVTLGDDCSGGGPESGSTRGSDSSERRGQAVQYLSPDAYLDPRLLLFQSFERTHLNPER